MNRNHLLALCLCAALFFGCNKNNDPETPTTDNALDNDPGLTVNEITWASENLSFPKQTKAAVSPTPAEMLSTPSASTGDYFQWGQSESVKVTGWKADNFFIIYDYPNRWNPDFDPCKRANASWRMPTAQEWETLKSTNHKFLRANEAGNPIAGTFYGENAQEATWNDPKDCIFFPVTGAYWDNSGEFVEGVSLYWSSSRYEDAEEDVGVGTIYYSAKKAYAAVLPGLGIIQRPPRQPGYGQDAAMPVRCVK